MNINTIARHIGIVLLFNAFFMFLSVVVSVANGFDSAFSPLFLSAVITFTAGFFPLIFVRKTDDINLKEGFTISVFSWLLSCLFGMLPYVLWGGEFSLINAWYESVSGYTTTGATILQDVEALPQGLLFWRSSTHFVGGIGVVIFMLLVLPGGNTYRLRLSKTEVSALSRENYKFKTRQTILVIGSVYIVLNVLEIILLMLAGMSFLDAVNHSFSTVATGGFSTRNESILAFHSFPIELIVSVFMVLGGMHFGLLYSLVIGKSLKIFHNPVVRFYLGAILIGGILVGFDIKISGCTDSWLMAFRESFFQVIAACSTTGFATADSSVWPGLSMLIIIYFSLQCACSGSTTGGIKVDRVFIFWQSFRRQLKRQMHPNATLPVRIGNQILEENMVTAVNVYIVLYLMIAFISAILLNLMGMSLLESFSASVANLGNVGPGFGSVGSLGNYSGVPVMAKFVLTVEMLLGRLEIYSVLLIFGIYKWR